MADQLEARKGAAFEDGLEIKVSSDKMRVTIDLDVTNLDKWNEKRIVQELAQEGIISCVNKEKISEMFAQNLFNQPVEVAKGTRAEDGKDGYVKYHIDTSRSRGTPKEREDGTADLKDLAVFVLIGKDDLLAELVDPTDGTVGKDVYGETVPCKPGKPAKLSGGKGTRLSEDGKKLHSDTDGILEGTPEKLEINPALVTEGNVGYETGNIESTVAVVINGNVLSGFKVKSTQDICVNGVVEAAEIETEGNITISAGVQGDNKAVLKAGGVITANFANEATLIARQGVLTKGGITHCNVETAGIVEAEGDRGIIVGGHICSGVMIAAQAIGSELGAKTEIELGPDMIKMEQQGRELQEKQASLEANMAKLQQVLKVLQAARATGRKLPPHQIKMAQQAITAHAQVTQQLKDITEANKELQTQLETERATQRFIHAKQIIWPGTKIRILNAQTVVKQPIQTVTMTVVDREIQTYGYRAKEKKETKGKKGKAEE